MSIAFPALYILANLHIFLRVFCKRRASNATLDEQRREQDRRHHDRKARSLKNVVKRVVMSNALRARSPTNAPPEPGLDVARP